MGLSSYICESDANFGWCQNRTELQNNQLVLDNPRMGTEKYTMYLSV